MQGTGHRVQGRVASACRGAWELLWKGLSTCLLSLGLGSCLLLRGSDPGRSLQAGGACPVGTATLGAEPRQTQEPRGHLHSCLQST